MKLIHLASLAVAALLVAGCENAPETGPLPEPEAQPGMAPDTTSSTAELIEKNVKTADIVVGRAKDPAKTVGFREGSTSLREKQMDGALSVESVSRQDADNHFVVTLNLLNCRDDAAAVFEWRIAFYDRKGAEVMSLNPEWKSKALEPKQFGTVSNSATVRGAVTFRLYTRTPQAAPAEAPAPKE